MHGNDLSRSEDQIRQGYQFSDICQETVPEALTCAVDAESFEDAARNAISLGGDTDTLAAIAGPITEAMHAIPPDIVVAAQECYLRKAPAIVDVTKAMYAAGRYFEPPS